MLPFVMHFNAAEDIFPTKRLWSKHVILKLCYVFLGLILTSILLIFIHQSEPVSSLVMLAFNVYKPQNFLYGGCSHHTCFNVELCEYAYPDSLPDRISVYVYPELTFIDGKQNHIRYKGSEEFRALLNAVNNSKYAVSDPTKACLFVSSLNFEGNTALSSSELLGMFLSFPW